MTGYVIFIPPLVILNGWIVSHLVKMHSIPTMAALLFIVFVLALRLEFDTVKEENVILQETVQAIKVHVDYFWSIKTGVKQFAHIWLLSYVNTLW